MKSKHNYKVIGVMSGTSLDGMDIACCRFRRKGEWRFEILSAVTLPYSPQWKEKLSSAHLLSAADLLILDAEYGKLIGENCKRFIRKHKTGRVDAIASHGHTIFHQPQKRMTFQIGNGNAIFAATDVPVIYDFRSLDVALNGEGAPLVPVGDQLLFPKYAICLNLGGIANLSMTRKKERIAFDVCFANMGLNYLAGKNQKAFDADGVMAAGGKIDNDMIGKLKEVYRASGNKRPSIGREGFEKDIQPILDDESISLGNRLRTFTESIADEIAAALPDGKSKMLVTGGGALNSFLVQRIAEKAGKVKLSIPPKPIIEFKEAMVFAFLGVLRLRGKINVLKSVTRASKDSCGGVIAGG